MEKTCVTKVSVSQCSVASFVEKIDFRPYNLVRFLDVEYVTRFIVM